MDKNTISITFAGDFIPDNYLMSYDDKGFDNVTKVLSDSDLNIINFESTVAPSDNPINKIGMHFSAPKESIEILKKIGFNAVCLANNHIYDFGEEGVTNTIKACEDVGIKYVGAGYNSIEAKEPLILEINDKKIAIINVCEQEFSISLGNQGGANHLDLISIYNDIIDLKSRVSFVFVVIHGGLEYHNIPLPEFKKKCEFFVDCGADAVVGHHTHMLGGYSYYKEKPIFYSLGNFYSRSLKSDKRLNYSYMVRFILKGSEISHNLFEIKHDTKLFQIKAGELSTPFIKELDDINQIISNDNLLYEYWDKFLEAESQNRINFIFSKSRFIFRLRKYLKLDKKLSRYQLLSVLNMVRCESHHEVLKMILEKEYKKL